MEGSVVRFCVQKERLTREMHHWGKRGDLRDVYARRLPLQQPLDAVVECFSSDREIDYRADYDRELD